jgi:hypothetical protein
MMDLYRRCIKDCDAAIVADATYLRAYIMKGLPSHRLALNTTLPLTSLPLIVFALRCDAMTVVGGGGGGGVVVVAVVLRYAMDWYEIGRALASLKKYQQARETWMDGMRNDRGDVELLVEMRLLLETPTAPPSSRHPQSPSTVSSASSVSRSCSVSLSSSTSDSASSFSAALVPDMDQQQRMLYCCFYRCGVLLG